MKRIFTLVVRQICFVSILVAGVYFPARQVQYSHWHKERLYRQLISGHPKQQLRAASALAYLDGQAQLLKGLRSETPEVRDLARRALEHIWFNAAGQEAYQLLETAFQASDKKDFQAALAILNRLVETFPAFAEGWNRRASVLWETGQFEKSITDSQRTLALNPNHYGAWQGIGVCRLKQGNVAEACRCLRAALKIIPYDEPTRHSLDRCEELLRLLPLPPEQNDTTDLI